MSQRPRWSVAAKAIVTLCLLALLVYLLARFRLVIPPLVLAAILAYVLTPIVDFLQARLRLRRGLAALLTYLVLLGLASLLPVLLVPALVDQLTGLNLDVGGSLSAVEGFFNRVIANLGWQLNTAELIGQLTSGFQAAIEPLFGQTIDIAFEFVSSIVWLVFIAVVSFYLVQDAARLRAWMQDLPPEPHRQDWIRLSREIGAVWSAFFRGQIVLALVVSIVITVLGMAVGLPYALAMGALAGLLEFLPSIGHGIWLFIASLLIFVQGSTWLPVPNWVAMLILIGLHLVFGQVDLNYLIPRIVGRRVHLHPLVVILGIVAGASLAGFLGILLAAPTIASARIVGRYLFANLFDLDPFPEEMEAPRDQAPAA